MINGKLVTPAIAITDANGTSVVVLHFGEIVPVLNLVMVGEDARVGSALSAQAGSARRSSARYRLGRGHMPHSPTVVKSGFSKPASRLRDWHILDAIEHEERVNVPGGGAWFAATGASICM